MLLDLDNGEHIIKGLRNSFYKCFFSKVNCPSGVMRLSYDDIMSVMVHASVSLNALK